MFTRGLDSSSTRSGVRRPRSSRGPIRLLSSPSPPGPSEFPWPYSSPLTAYDQAYSRSYPNISIHEEMIKDSVRTETYRNAIFLCRRYIRGKVVMDVGSGTGILSIFCARVGAKKVYAVEASDIAVQAKEIVRANNLAKKVIVLQQRVEDVEIGEKVDVIISEWMGYMLVYKSMLPSVIFARDKWLKQGGLILPSHVTLYMAPVTHPVKYQECVDFWRNVYGYDMSAMLPLAQQCSFEEPIVETIKGENVLSWPILVKDVNCYTVVAQELECISAQNAVSSIMNAPLHGFAFWFDVEFDDVPCVLPISQFPAASSPSGLCTNNPFAERMKRVAKGTTVLSTGPEHAPTHWEQTLFYFYSPIEMKKDQRIECSIKLSRSQENARFLNIHLECSSGSHSLIKDVVLR